jgi:hypothetical protein
MKVIPDRLQDQAKQTALWAFLFGQNPLYARSGWKFRPIPPRALLDDIPACAISHLN